MFLLDVYLLSATIQKEEVLKGSLTADGRVVGLNGPNQQGMIFRVRR